MVTINNGHNNLGKLCNLFIYCSDTDVHKALSYWDGEQMLPMSKKFYCQVE